MEKHVHGQLHPPPRPCAAEKDCDSIRPSGDPIATAARSHSSSRRPPPRSAGAAIPEKRVKAMTRGPDVHGHDGSGPRSGPFRGAPHARERSGPRQPTKLVLSPMSFSFFPARRQGPGMHAAVHLRSATERKREQIRHGAFRFSGFLPR
eukprot:scaffold442_cov268-Pinguiococcus_pyrenoidosus.AAC.98